MGKMKVYLLSIIVWCCISCGDFLKEYSQDLVYASSCSDLNEMLIGSGYLNPNLSFHSFTWGGTSSNQYPYINVMDDDVEAHNRYSSFVGILARSGESLEGFYQWKVSPFVNVGMPIDDFEWERLYRHIAVTNVVISQVKEFPADDETLRNKVRGEACFLRAAYYFLLVNFYAEPYAEENLMKPGVPLKLTEYVQDKQYDRTRLDSVYSSIVYDLQQAIDCLKDGINEKSCYRVNEYAARLLLSRVYLYMGKWQLALDECDAFDKSFYMLRDLNEEYTDNFLSMSSPEIIFTQGTSNWANVFGTDPGLGFRVSSDLVNLYGQDISSGMTDLRRTHFVKRAFNVSSRDVPGKMAGLFGASRGDVKVRETYLLRYAEVLLNKAEALAMLNRESEAIVVINELRKNRFQDGKIPEISVSGKELMDLIRDERRKELCFEGHRWFDLRRYAVHPKYPIGKDYELVHNVYEIPEKSGAAQLIGRCVLKLSDAWVLPIPDYELNISPDIEANERKGAVYTEIN